uniref:Ribosomal protein L32 n=1 Tax=Romanomermis culicivorax TaxID=13658 RepID=A0A915K8U9_ROMCU
MKRKSKNIKMANVENQRIGLAFAKRPLKRGLQERKPVLKARLHNKADSQSEDLEKRMEVGQP